jgi:hypothetical protein
VRAAPPATAMATGRMVTPAVEQARDRVTPTPSS